ncbi:hypothetical protein L3Y34_002812 [Caenorhabditis briggsae]|uniref:Uncharacterized protein n=1 Tax=Caenorhabditis briggsae TaxID=6238 RepID=A0AAE9A5V1_CAEBR|nr:hypothetical protein L3Y34_002812 [Caenorhabditis briggsae]
MAELVEKVAPCYFVINPLHNKGFLKDNDHGEIMEEYILNGTKAGLFDPRKLLFLFSQSDVPPTFENLRKLESFHMEEIRHDDNMKLIRKSRARSIALNDKELEHKERSICPMVLTLTRMSSFFTENWFGASRTRIGFSRKIKSIEKMVDCSGDALQTCYRVMLKFGTRSREDISVVGFKEISYDVLLIEMQNMCKAEKYGKLRFECGRPDYKTSDSGKVEQIIKMILQSDVFEKDSTINRIFYNHKGELSLKDFNTWLSQSEIMSIHNQMRAKLNDECVVLREKNDDEWSTLKVDKTPLKATILVSVISTDGIENEIVFDMGSFRVVKLITPISVAVENVIEFACLCSLKMLDSDEVEVCILEQCTESSTKYDWHSGEDTEGNEQNQSIESIVLLEDDIQVDETAVIEKAPIPDIEDPDMVPVSPTTLSPPSASSSPHDQSHSGTEKDSIEVPSPEITPPKEPKESFEIEPNNKERDDILDEEENDQMDDQSKKKMPSQEITPPKEPSELFEIEPNNEERDDILDEEENDQMDDQSKKKVPSDTTNDDGTEEDKISDVEKEKLEELEGYDSDEEREKGQGGQEEVFQDGPPTPKKSKGLDSEPILELKFSEDEIIFNKDEKVFTLKDFHSIGVHGCVLRPINEDVVMIMDFLPVEQLFDPLSSSKPVFISCKSIPDQLIVIESTHRLVSVLSRFDTVEKIPDYSFKADVYCVDSGDFCVTYKHTKDLRGKKSDLAKKCNFADLPWNVVAIAQTVFTAERLRTENRYTAYDRALNLYQILEKRVNPKDVELLATSPRFRNQLYDKLAAEKTVIESTEASTEKSGLYIYLCAPRTKKMFLSHFHVIPAKEKSHQLTFVASRVDDLNTARLIYQRYLEKISRAEYSERIRKIIESKPKRAASSKPKQTRSDGLVVWDSVEGVPMNCLLILQDKIPEPIQLVAKNASVILLNGEQSKATMNAIGGFGSNEILRFGIFKKNGFTAAGDRIVKGDVITSTTVSSLITRLTRSDGSKKRKIDDTESKNIGTIKGFEPK